MRVNLSRHNGFLHAGRCIGHGSSTFDFDSGWLFHHLIYSLGVLLCLIFSPATSV